MEEKNRAELEEMFFDNLGLVYAISLKHKGLINNSPYSIRDLVQEGCEGLWKAVENHQEEHVDERIKDKSPEVVERIRKKNRSYFLGKSIEHKILNFIEKSRLVRTPRVRNKKYDKRIPRRVRETMNNRNLVRMANLNLPPGTSEIVSNIRKNYYLSIDVRNNDEEEIDISKNEAFSQEPEIWKRDYILEFIESGLDPIERDIIILTYGFYGLTSGNDISGNRMGGVKKRRQILGLSVREYKLKYKSAMEKIKKFLTDNKYGRYKGGTKMKPLQTSEQILSFMDSLIEAGYKKLVVKIEGKLEVLFISVVDGFEDKGFGFAYGINKKDVAKLQMEDRKIKVPYKKRYKLQDINREDYI